MELVTIKLGEKSWLEGLEESSYLNLAKGSWRTDPGRVIRCDTAVVVSPASRIAAVGKIKGVHKEEDKRVSLETEVDTSKHSWVGKCVNRNTSQNPIAYFNVTDFERYRITDCDESEQRSEKPKAIRRKVVSIDDLFQDYEGDYEAPEIDWGTPQGKEMW